MQQTHSLRAKEFLASIGVVVVLIGLVLAMGHPLGWAQNVQNLPGSLKTVPTPEPPNLNQFLLSNNKGITPGARAAVIALGKALFWDQAVGSDGQACASCHYNAGADSRTRNQVDPGLRAIPPQSVFGAMPPQQTTGSAAQFTADYQLHATDFPLTRFTNQQDHKSGIVSDTQAVVSSQGVINSIFGDITLSPCPPDQPNIGNLCDKSNVDISGNGAIFGAANHVRNVEPRNTPTVINAVFNFRNFWDSRARNEFNGVNPIGDLDPYARVLLASGSGNSAKLSKIALNGVLRLEDASLASQAVGPALSDMEMSAQQRSFAKLGKKMLALPYALPRQIVAPDDSVLGNNNAASVKSNSPLPGINKKYADLIQAAFQSRWYASNLMVEFTGGTDADGTVGLKISKPTKALTTNQFTQMEFNFSLFWGIAIQMYEATLRADDSAFDQAFDSGNPLTFVSSKWGDQEKAGWQAFQGVGKCIGCHGGPELTNASVRNVRLIDGKTENMTMANLGIASYDVGFYNVAARRCLDQKAGSAACDDGGIGVTIGPLNLPLSYVRFGQMLASHDPTNPSDPITIVCNNQPTACTNVLPLSSFQRVAVDGAVKASGLRNIELTAPYLHNGGELSLRDVVDFYDRGGNFPEYNVQNLDPDIGNVNRVRLSLPLLFSAATAAPPLSGAIQFNSGSFGSITHVYVSTTDRNGVDVSGSEALLMLGILGLVQDANPTQTAAFFATDMSQQAGYYDITVVAQGGVVPIDGASVEFSFDSLVFTELGLSDDTVDSKTGQITPGELNALAAFLKALTDERVRYQRAPFDHPQLFVPNLGGERDPVTGNLLPNIIELPAVGRNGSIVPLKTFFENLP